MAADGRDGAAGTMAVELDEAALAAAAIDDASAADLLPERPAEAHKGTFGRLLVVAGSLDYAGAALLVAAAATRAGAGLVTLAVPASLQALFAGRVPEVTTLGLVEREPGVVDPEEGLAALVARPHEGIVVGPGLPARSAADELVRRVLSGEGEAPTPPAPAPVLVDAEGLNGLARRPGWWHDARRPAVLTPHPGEFARLAAADAGLGVASTPVGDRDRAGAARAAARSWGHVVVLKGARTIVAAPDGALAIAPFANPALATAGTGDVLSGTIGGLLAQGLSPWDAARLGVYLHGMAGEAVREALGDSGAVASDLLVQIPLARRRLASIRGRGRRPLGFSASRGERP